MDTKTPPTEFFEIETADDEGNWSIEDRDEFSSLELATAEVTSEHLDLARTRIVRFRRTAVYLAQPIAWEAQGGM